MTRMFFLKLFALALATGLAAGAVSAEPAFTVSGKVHTAEFQPGTWQGEHEFSGVFCTRFPMPEKASQSRWALFNDFSVYLADASYPDHLSIAVASSLIPSGHTPEQEIDAILNTERQTEAEATKAGYGYRVSELASGFGRTIGLVTVNPADGSDDGPFPLTRTFIAKADDALQSLSVHRLFVHDEDRFEIAVIQLEVKGLSLSALTLSLDKLADEMLQNMQKCTLAMPAKKTTATR